MRIVGRKLQPNNPMSNLPPTLEQGTYFTNAAPQPFPEIGSAGIAPDLKQCVESGTSSARAIAYLLTSLGLLIGIAVSSGVLLIMLLIAVVLDYFNRKKAMALIRGSGIEVGPHQFPQLYACAVTYAERLGMPAPPSIFILEGNTINAFAVRVGGRKVVLLNDDIVDACLRSGDPQTLAFILGHELAHHALGHTGLIRSYIARAWKKLARLDEFSCDAVANQLVGDSRISAKALVTLLAGPQLLRFVNFNQLSAQAADVAIDKQSRKAERALTHPLILRRIHRFQN